MIDSAYLESDEGGWVLVLEDMNGTHLFPCDPQLIEDAVAEVDQFSLRVDK